MTRRLSNAGSGGDRLSTRGCGCSGRTLLAQGKPNEATAQYALVDVIHKLNQANGVIGDMQMAQFFADHTATENEVLQMAEKEYATRPTVYVADTTFACVAYYKHQSTVDAADDI